MDKYQGSTPKTGKSYPEQLAKSWDGKLLLVQSLYGGMTSLLYPPSGAFRVVEALQKVNKDVDLLAITAPSHGGFILGRYEQRRIWDYFVKHLQGSVPPKEFKLGEFQQ